MGDFLLHLGMTVTLLFSFVYVLTEHWVIVRLVAGEPVTIGEGRRGLLAGSQPLPDVLTLVTMRPAFWRTTSCAGWSQIWVDSALIVLPYALLAVG